MIQTVTALRANLKGVEGKLPLVYAKDSEGNGYEYVHYSAEVCYVDKNSEWGIDEVVDQASYDEFTNENKKQYKKVLVIN